MGPVILFAILAIIAIAAALGMVFSRNAIHSALYLVLNFGVIAVFYLLLNAPFIAMVQVAVYAGAIMVLFLFVIMLLGAERAGGEAPEPWQRPLAVFLGLCLAATLITSFFADPQAASTVTTMDASPAALGIALFERYVFPFEVTSVLLLTAMIGVVVLRSRKQDRSG
jgi:NADH-quinone oxidoreductase subunit J